MMNRKSVSPPPNGELATYSKFRDRFMMAVCALAVIMMGYFVHQNQTQVDTLHADITAVRAEIAQVRDRLVADQNTNTGLAARVGTQADDTLRRLDGIDKKLDSVEGKLSAIHR